MGKVTSLPLTLTWSQMKTSSLSVSVPTDLSQDRDLAPPSSGPPWPITFHQHLPTSVSLPVLAGSKELAGFFLCPCLPRNRMCPQDLMTLPAALPRPFPTYEGPVQGTLLLHHACAYLFLDNSTCLLRRLGHGLDGARPFRTSTCICISLFLLFQTMELLRMPSSAQWAGSLLIISNWGQVWQIRHHHSTPLRLAGFFPWHVQHRLHDQRDLPTPSPRQAWLQIPVPPASSTSAPAPLPAPSQSDVVSLMAAPSTLTAPPDVQAWMKDWQDAFFKTMQDRTQVLMGDAQPQPTAGSSIQQNMDPNELRQLSTSSDREASRAQHKSGTKRAHGCSRSRSPTGEVSEANRDSRSLYQQLRDFSASSSSSRRPSLPSSR